MTKSLGGLALAASTVISGGGGLMNHSTMAGKTAENGSSGSAGGGAGGAGNNGMVDMSKSLASFHLSSSATTAGGGSSGIGNGANGNNQTSNSTRNRAMDESVDHLFKEGKTIYIITNSYYRHCQTTDVFLEAGSDKIYVLRFDSKDNIYINFFY